MSRSDGPDDLTGKVGTALYVSPEMMLTGSGKLSYSQVMFLWMEYTGLRKMFFSQVTLNWMGFIWLGKNVLTSGNVLGDGVLSVNKMFIHQILFKELSICGQKNFLKSGNSLEHGVFLFMKNDLDIV